MSKNIILPVIIEDMVKKVGDKRTSVETRQHYANSLRNIQKVVADSLVQFDKEYKEYFNR